MQRKSGPSSGAAGGGSNAPSQQNPGPDVFDMLAEKMESQAVSEGNVFADHPRFSQFKNAGKMAESQKARREEWLERQRSGRLNQQERRRPTSNSMEAAPAQSLSDSQKMELQTRNQPIADVPEVRMEEAAEEQDLPSEWRPVKKRRQRKSIAQHDSTYKGLLMFSEWLIDIPMNFEDDWKMILAPTGQRSLLVMEAGNCNVYNKLGRLLRTFHRTDQMHPAIWMDCIMSPRNIFVIDFLKANGMDVEQCDFECRRGLGKAAMDELKLLTEVGPDGHTFHFMDAVLCHQEDMKKALEPVQNFKLDGLMFYHKDGLYSAGITPLVCWLKPWMMVDVLKVDVPAYYMEGKTATSQQEFIESFNQSHPSYGLPVTRRKPKDRSRTTSKTEEFMETESPSTSKPPKAGTSKTSR